MKIYIDVVLFINFSFDLLLLISVSIILKRNAKISKLLIASFIGSLSILFLFVNVNSFQLFILKVIISIIMVIISFGYKTIKYFLKNILFLYTSSIILGGFIYFLSITFSYKNTGLVFYFKGLSINYIVLLVSSPIILFIYIKQAKNLKTFYNNVYNVKLVINKTTYNLKGYIDSGNNLVDPVFHKPVVLINKVINTKNFILVPFNGIKESGIIKCIKGDIYLNNKKYEVLVGTNYSIELEGIECLLNNKMEVK